MNPLHSAARGGHTEVVRLLLDRGASTEGKMSATEDGYWDRTPLHCAAEEGHINVVRLLLDRGANIQTTMSVSAIIDIKIS